MEAVGELSRPNSALCILAEALAFSYRNITKGIETFSKKKVQGEKIAPPPQSYCLLSLTTCARGCTTVAEKWNGIIILRLYLYHREQKKLS